VEGHIYSSSFETIYDQGGLWKETQVFFFELDIPPEEEEEEEETI